MAATVETFITDPYITDMGYDGSGHNGYGRICSKLIWAITDLIVTDIGYNGYGLFVYNGYRL